MVTLQLHHVELGIGGKSPTLTEPQFTTGDGLRPWLIIAIRNSQDTRRTDINQTERLAEQ